MQKQVSDVMKHETSTVGAEIPVRRKVEEPRRISTPAERPRQARAGASRRVVATHAPGGIMTTTLDDPAASTAQPVSSNEPVSSAEPMELLHCMLEEQYTVDTARLTQLTVHAALPRHAGYHARTLDLQITSVQQRIAETAQALRRMSEGTYGLCGDCHRPIPLGRLRVEPQATHCTLCQGRRSY